MSVTPDESDRLDEISAMSDADLDAALEAGGIGPRPGASREERECELFMQGSRKADACLDEAGRAEYLRRVGLDPEEARRRVSMLAFLLRSGLDPDEVSRVLRAHVEVMRRQPAPRAGTLH